MTRIEIAKLVQTVGKKEHGEREREREREGGGKEMANSEYGL